MKPKKELVRIVRAPDDSISIDTTGKKAGRGAYICRNVECLEKAQKGKKLNKAFGITVNNEIYDQIRKELIGLDKK